MDIYSDIDNLEQFEDVGKLKSENTELKSKLQEYKVTMDKLKLDFDKLTAEHNTLLRNFSSLMKTAKAEIERKTETIRIINNEKDQLFLRFIENSNGKLPKPYRYHDKGKQNKDNAQDKSNEPVSGKENCSSDRTKSTDQRKPPSHKESMKKEESINEGLSQERNQSKTIAHRRPSVPASREPDLAKFSSDEGEIESDVTSFKSSDPSVEERYPSNRRDYYDDSYRSRHRQNAYDERPKDRFADDKRYRNADRCVPDRQPRWRGQERKSEDYKMGNPRERYDTRDKYQRSKSRDRRRDRFDYKPPYERGSYKHKLNENPQEPVSKRRRDDSYKQDEHRREPASSWKPEHLQEDRLFPTSCQSPDEAADSQTEPQPVKEILDTASTRLEDPRFASSRYITIADSQNRVAASNLNERGDLIVLGPWKQEDPVKKPSRQIEDIPTEDYSNLSETQVQQIYMNIDKEIAARNRSVIKPIEIDVYMGAGSDVSKSSEICKKEEVSNSKSEITELPVKKVNPPPSRQVNEEIQKSSETKSVDTHPTTNKSYKIPKRKRTKSNSKDVIADTPKIGASPLDILFQISNVKTKEKSEQKESQPHRRSEEKETNKLKSNPRKPKKSETIAKETPKDSFIDRGVEGDLELSDETCDNESNIPAPKEHTKPNIENDKPKTKTTEKEISKTKQETEKDTKGVSKINAKITDLFGDTSLITPEDLNIRTELPAHHCPEALTPSEDSCTEKDYWSVLRKSPEKSSRVTDTVTEVAYSKSEILVEAEPDNAVHRLVEATDKPSAQVKDVPAKPVNNPIRSIFDTPVKDFTTSTPARVNITSQTQADSKFVAPLSKQNLTDSKQKETVQNLVDTKNTSSIVNVSQTNATDAPDVKIVLKRKRRVLKS